MKPWLYVGAKVVCVDATDRFSTRPGGMGWPKCHDGLTQGRIYTVRAVGPQPWNAAELGVFLVEIVRPTRGNDPCEIGFNADRFAPAINTDSQVAAMRELMQRAVKTQRVDA